MGTSFYWITVPGDIIIEGVERPKFFYGRYDDSPYVHIGKRSGAGRYCYNCDITMCDEGNNLIHTARGTWHDKCPLCFKDVNTTTCSFSWAQPEERVWIECMKHLRSEIILDECGGRLTGIDFVQSMRYNRIRFHHSIGKYFS